MKKINLTLLALTTIATTFAQKLPNVQQVSLRAPANIKIDGKAAEWGDKFQAFNNATGVFYSIANDSENLYLVIYSNSIAATGKILAEGMNISFNAKKKSTDNSVLIKYPIAPIGDERNERNKLIMSKLSKDGETIKADDRKAGQLSLNKAIIAANKHIKVLGLNALTDTLFSIYDAKGIIVSMDGQEGNLLCYELSIPLKYLGILPSAKLNYNIRVNENWLSHYMSPVGILPDGKDEGAMMYATDFWGEYTLAK
ncbi:hypothetical protein [Mucilaginibacter sp. HD30]